MQQALQSQANHRVYTTEPPQPRATESAHQPGEGLFYNLIDVFTRIDDGYETPDCPYFRDQHKSGRLQYAPATTAATGKSIFLKSTLTNTFKTMIIRI
jgi:hypothetical protein